MPRAPGSSALSELADVPVRYITLSPNFVIGQRHVAATAPESWIERPAAQVDANATKTEILGASSHVADVLYARQRWWVW